MRRVLVTVLICEEPVTLDGVNLWCFVVRLNVGFLCTMQYYFYTVLSRLVNQPIDDILNSLNLLGSLIVVCVS